MRTLLASVIAVGVLGIAAANAEPSSKLSNEQMDRITAGASANSRDTTLFHGNSANECTTKCTNEGIKTVSSNKGNPTNTKCSDCGVTSRPGKNR
jgi:hypothetical protein